MTKEEAVNHIRYGIIEENYHLPKELGIEACEMAIKALEQEPCEDAISRESIKQKLQEHHDFFVNAYGGFSNLPQNDKSRVDEITNCIAMVVNEPPVTPQPKIGHWIESKGYDDRDHFYTCSECGRNINLICGATLADYPYCHCGAKMEVEE